MPFFWFVFSLAVAMDGGRLDKTVLCGLENLNSAQGERVVSPSVIMCTWYMVRHPGGSYIVCPLLSLEVVTPESNSIHSTLSSNARKYVKGYKNRLTSGS